MPSCDSNRRSSFQSFIAARHGGSRAWETSARRSITRSPGRTFSAASELLAAHWNEINSAGGLRAVEIWLMSVPEPILIDDARLGLARAWASFTKGAFEEVLPCLATAQAAPADKPPLDGNTSLGSGAATLRASYWLQMGDFEKTVTYAREALALEHGPWRAISAGCLGVASYWLDQNA
jgi:ATP/maltotriose-dependent transcriptional regulator MalT